jgi:hypothetical protein
MSLTGWIHGFVKAGIQDHSMSEDLKENKDFFASRIKEVETLYRGRWRRDIENTLNKGTTTKKVGWINDFGAEEGI